MPDLYIATRASALARAQTQTVVEAVARLTGRTVAAVPMTSDGDRTTAPLHTLGGQGVFVTTVRAALLDGRAQIAVHSLKDLPTAPHPDTVIAAIPAREDPRDLLVSAAAGLPALPEGARVGTGSPRRTAFLRAARPDLQVVPLRGNVDSRVRRVTSGELDAVVVAAAGVHRLGLHIPGTPIPADVMLPAPGQGALAVEVLADSPWAEVVAGLDDAPTRAAVTAERELLRRLEAGCSAPVGALAEVGGGRVRLRAAVVSEDGHTKFVHHQEGPVDQAAGVGEATAQALLADGAEQLIGEGDT